MITSAHWSGRIAAFAAILALVVTASPAHAHRQKGQDKKQGQLEDQTTDLKGSMTGDETAINDKTGTENALTGKQMPASQNAVPFPHELANAPAVDAATPVATATGAATGGIDLSSLSSLATNAMTGMAMMQALPMLGGLAQSVIGAFTGGGGGGGSSSASDQGVAQALSIPTQLQSMPAPDTSSFDAARGSTASILYVPIAPQNLEPQTVAAITNIRQKTIENAAIDAYSVAVIGKNDAGNTSTLAAKLESCITASSNIRTDWQCNTAAFVTQNQQLMSIVQSLNHLMELRAANAINADSRISSITVNP